MRKYFSSLPNTEYVSITNGIGREGEIRIYYENPKKGE